MNRTLKQDLDGPLEEVSRTWLRIPVLIAFSVLILPVGLIFYTVAAACEFFGDFISVYFAPCWKGPKP